MSGLALTDERNPPLPYHSYASLSTAAVSCISKSLGRLWRALVSHSVHLAPSPFPDRLALAIPVPHAILGCNLAYDQKLAIS